MTDDTDPNQPRMEMPPPFDPDPSLIKHVDVVRLPHERHQCTLPWEDADVVGTIVRCRQCGKRYELKYQPPYQGFPGRIVWVRRYWPWPR